MGENRAGDKSECRMSKSERSSKTEIRKRSAWCSWRSIVLKRAQKRRFRLFGPTFGFRVSFGSRISAFGFLFSETAFENRFTHNKHRGTLIECGVALGSLFNVFNLFNRFILPNGQNQGKRTAGIYNRLHTEAGFKFAGEFIDHREAKAGTAPGGQCFGREKRIENAGQIFGLDAAAEVLHGNQGVLVRRGWRKHGSCRQTPGAAEAENDLLSGGGGLRFRRVEHEI